MALSFTHLVTIAYISLNALLTLFVSILGVKYVRDEMKIQKKTEMTAPSKSSNVMDAENDTKPDAGSSTIIATSIPSTIEVCSRSTESSEQL